MATFRWAISHYFSLLAFRKEVLSWGKAIAVKPSLTPVGSGGLLGGNITASICSYINGSGIWIYERLTCSYCDDWASIVSQTYYAKTWRLNINSFICFISHQLCLCVFAHLEVSSFPARTFPKQKQLCTLFYIYQFYHFRMSWVAWRSGLRRVVHPLTYWPETV